jgi:peptide chain release factor 2
VVLKAIRALGNLIDEWREFQDDLEELETGLSLIEEQEDPELQEEIRSLSSRLEKRLTALEIKNLLGGEQDQSGAIAHVHAGAGGTESADWCQMLSRMYQRWGESHGYQVTVLDFQPGEEAGLKSITFSITGDYAYGNLKTEAGVHRLVRISPFDAASRRHTSFASVFVFPDIEDSIEVEINEGDLQIDTYRAQGAGGQHINTTDSAVRITHAPSGIVVQCQNERSQHKNRATAMRVLRARLYERELQERRTEKEELHAQKRQIAWGSQIRSYVLHPYQMVKDHRTDTEINNAQRVLDGDLDGFIEQALIKQVV